jgi:hypothetical protein
MTIKSISAAFLAILVMTSSSGSTATFNLKPYKSHVEILEETKMDTLRRFDMITISRSHQVTQSVLTENGIATGIVMLERPWEFNQANESCLPAGAYVVKRHYSKKYNDKNLAWIIEDVTGRTGMLIHVGNTIDQSKGCALPGIYFDEYNGKPAVKDSRKALSKLQMITNGEPFELIIHRPF